MTKVSTNFHLHEFIDKKTYKKWGGASIWFIDQKIIHIAQFIRDRHKLPVTVNGLFKGVTFNYSGFDPPGGYRRATSLSQHRFGRAVDVKISGMSAQELYKDIIKNQDLYMKVGVTTVENISMTPSWNHLDCRHTGLDKIKIVNP